MRNRYRLGKGDCYWCDDGYLVMSGCDDGHSIMCNNCGATGPLAKTKAAARRLWDKGPRNVAILDHVAAQTRAAEEPDDINGELV